MEVAFQIRAPFRAALFLLTLLAPTSVLAGPPYATDDPEPVEHHHWEIYVATMDQWSGAKGWSGTAPHFDVNYGLLPGVQAHFTVPFTWAKIPGQPIQFGLGDIEVGSKVRLTKERGWVPQISTYPLLEIPSGDAGRGLGAGRVQLFIPLWLQKTFGPWTTYGGIGYWLNPGPSNLNWWYFGWVLQRQVLENVAVGVELFHGTSRERNASGETRFNLGAVWDISSLHHVLFSAGRAFGTTSTQIYLAWQLTFDGGGCY